MGERSADSGLRSKQKRRVLRLPQIAKDPLKYFRPVNEAPTTAYCPLGVSSANRAAHKHLMDQAANRVAVDPDFALVNLPSAAKFRVRRKSWVTPPLTPRGDSVDVEGNVIPSELTKTYLSVLARSEDYNRRMILRAESERARRFSAKHDAMCNFASEWADRFEDVFRAELEARTCAGEEECELRVELMLRQAKGALIARRYEDVPPRCALLERQQPQCLTSEVMSSEFVLEIRHRSNLELSIFAAVFDKEYRILGVATQVDWVKSASGLVSIRGTEAYRRDRGNLYVQLALQFKLEHLPPHATRVIFGMLNASSVNATFSQLQRCWCTFKAPSSSPSSLVQKAKGAAVFDDLYAHRIEPTPYGSLLVSSLTRTGDSSWWYTVHDQGFHDVRHATKFAVNFSNLMCHGTTPLEQLVAQHYARVELQNLLFWEEIGRAHIELCSFDRRPRFGPRHRPAVYRVTSLRALVDSPMKKPAPPAGRPSPRIAPRPIG